MDFYKRASEIKDKITEHRRFFHKNAETGSEMPIACGYVMQKLDEYGIKGKKCGHGITAVIGKDGPVILLRADMDALPMKEESGEEFACENGAAHTCGHDLHAAMLLGAAEMLAENADRLKGRVKLMFQPAEETLQGCRDMIENGVLEEPVPEAALAFHVAAGKIPVGTVLYNSGGVMMSSADSFRIEIKGKGGHGAYPHLTVDPIGICNKIYSALEAAAAKETAPEKACTITVGSFHGGDAPNIIPDCAAMEGMVRTDDRQLQIKLVKRIADLAEAYAKAYGGTAQVTFYKGAPPLVCDRKLTEEIVGFMQEGEFSQLKLEEGIKASASEDFALIAEKISSAFMYLSAGFEDGRGEFTAHNPKVRFNEEVLPVGAACLAHCAVRWLEKRGQ